MNVPSFSASQILTPVLPFSRTMISSAVAAVLLLGVQTQDSWAKTATWNGLGADANWNTNLNWVSSAKPVSGDSLIFAGITRRSNSNNIAGLTIADLAFAANAGAFTLGGNGLTITGIISNPSNNIQTINLPLTVNSTGKIWDGGTKGIILNGAFTLGNNNLTLKNKIAINNLSTAVAIGNTGIASLVFLSGSTLSDSSGILGNQVTGSGTVSVDGAGSAWTNSGTLNIGNYGIGILNIQNSGKVSNTAGYLGTFAGSTGTATVDGVGSNWVNSGDLVVGSVGTGTLNIQNGGRVSNVGGFLGNNATGSGTATVSGAGSTWTNSGTLSVGNAGTGTLNVQNGGTVSSAAGTITSGTAKATVDGVGSNWVNSGALTVGAGTLNVQNGGMVSNGAGAITSGTATVNGVGSNWINSTLIIGNGQGIGRLDIQNGGKVSSYSGMLGFDNQLFGVNTGIVTVDGADSIWTISASLSVGAINAGLLKIQNGGTVRNSVAYIGSEKRSLGKVTVDGAGSSWVNSDDLFVGYGRNGFLNIQNGAMVSDTSGYIGGIFGGCSSCGPTGTVTVDGAGSIWTHAKDLYIGSISGGNTVLLDSLGDQTNMLQENTLTIQNGGKVSNVIGDIGNKGNGVGFVTVTGASSTWINSGALFVGNAGTGTLNIQNAGQVSSVTGYLGNSATGRGIVTVSGAGSTWANSGTLFVGNAGTGTLNVQNGGTVSNVNGGLGNLAASIGNATVNGVGSNWTNAGDLIVGSGGTGTLNVQNGGTVSNVNGGLGNLAGSIGTATVNGSDSSWDNSESLFIGKDGIGVLNIENGGKVSAKSMNLGKQGVVNLTGGTLRVGSSSSTTGAQFNWQSGTVSTEMAVLGNSILGSDSVLTLFTGRTFQVDQTLTVDSSNLLVLAGGQLKTGALNLLGGTVVAITGLNLSEAGNLGGYGQVSGDILGGSGKSITASGGNLSLGNINSNHGFNFAGTLEVGSNQVVLQDKDNAELGISTQLGSGGSLVSANGINLNSGQMLTFNGDARIQGNFTNNGAVSGTDGALTFLNDVNGAGSFGGNIHFHADYNPGNSPASISFNNGDVTFDTSSTLTLEILGNTPGTEYDQLTDIDLLTFDGILKLVFGDTFTPTVDSELVLFGFNGFAGSLSADKIQVSGFDTSRLDFSRLATTGRLGVNALPIPAALPTAPVPVPSAYVLMLSGLALLGRMIKRRQCSMNAI